MPKPAFLNETRDAGIHILNYKSPPTLTRFHLSDGFVRGVCGPVGSGKSTACVMELLRVMVTQEPTVDGIRMTRFGIIRNTYGELRDTTLQTWQSWFSPRYFGRVKTSDTPFVHDLHFQLADGTTVQSQAVFTSMDREDDVRKMMSNEFTMLWMNEARFLRYTHFATFTDRVGRWPSQRFRPKHLKKEQWPTRFGVIMDTNPPETTHWYLWYTGDADWPKDLSKPQENKPFRFFRQPPAAFERRDAHGNPRWEVNPKAENIENLPGGMGYYEGVISGKPHHYIRVFAGGEYGAMAVGKPVYPDFNPDVHLARGADGRERDIVPIPGKTVYVGIDGGLNPAASFSQKIGGVWYDLYEIVVTSSMGMVEFSELVCTEIQQFFPEGCQFEFWCDPSMAFRGEATNESGVDMLRAHGIDAQPAPFANQKTQLRHEAGSLCMRRMVHGKPGLQVAARCKYLKAGLGGKFRYREVATSGGQPSYSDKTVKDIYSHVCEAREYAYAGAGEVHQQIKIARKSLGEPWNLPQNAKWRRHDTPGYNTAHWRR